MTLVELEALSSQLQLEALEERACNPSPMARCDLFTSGSPRRPWTPRPQSGTFKSLQMLESSGRGKSTLVGNGTLPRQLEDTTPRHPSSRQPLQITTSSGVSGDENNVVGISGCHPSKPGVPPLPIYKPPVVGSHLSTREGTKMPSALLVQGANSVCPKQRKGLCREALSGSSGACSGRSLPDAVLPLNQPSPREKDPVGFEELQWLEGIWCSVVCFLCSGFCEE